MNENKMDKYFADIAIRTALLSDAVKRKVGCLIVKDGNILSFGWNGTPKGFSNICEDISGETLSIVIHAEVNAISKLAKINGNAKDSIIYITRSPCYDCAKLILQSGIKEVHYLSTSTKYFDAINFLVNASIICKAI